MLENSVRSPYLLAFLVDLLEDEAENGDAQSLEKAKEVCCISISLLDMATSGCIVPGTNVTRCG